jgi:hypothetical protein
LETLVSIVVEDGKYKVLLYCEDDGINHEMLLSDSYIESINYARYLEARVKQQKYGMTTVSPIRNGV